MSKGEAFWDVDATHKANMLPKMLRPYTLFRAIVYRLSSLFLSHAQQNRAGDDDQQQRHDDEAILVRPARA